MATVYLAEDLKHERQVALKLLRPELAAVLGADRFVQEIKTTANLQHPHILPLFDSGTAGGDGDDGPQPFLYYVMPFIDGETLRDKLDRETQLGIDEAVSITTQLADALDYAHRQGIIHRDIKPENILMHDGRPMLADFGIALAVSAAAGGRMTETGLSLGTPHYMSPEQATAEKELTNRSDIYSLGSVLFEMLTGEPPHTGASAQAIVMKIVTDEARPITELRKSVPPNVAAATAKSLEKLAADRFESAAAFGEALANSAFTYGTLIGVSYRPDLPTSRRPNSAAFFAATTTIALLVALWGWLRTGPDLSQPAIRYSMALPADEQISSQPSRIAITPDGAHIIYVGGADDDRSLLVRSRSQLGATRLPGTEGAWEPMPSPDGSRVAFFARPGGRGTVLVSLLAGGPPQQILEEVWNGSWGGDGYLYLTGTQDLRLLRVRATGGPPEELVVNLDSTDGYLSHPEWLPGNRAIMVSLTVGRTTTSVGLLDLATGEHRTLFPAAAAKYSPSGHILYVTDDQTLFAVQFDAERLEVIGDPVVVASGVRLGGNGWSDFDVSDEGTLVYTTGGGTGVARELVSVSRSGVGTAIDPGWADVFETFAISPDGLRLAVSIRSDDDRQIWVKQLPQGPLTKLTLEGATSDRPSWSADGRQIVFRSNRSDGEYDIYTQRADGSAGAELLADASRPLWEGFWSPDEEWLILRTAPGDSTGRDIFAMRSGDSALIPLVVTEAQEQHPALSPDGRWMAYVSDFSGTNEVYVRPFPDTDAALWQASNGGGRAPLWSHDGRELFFWSDPEDGEGMATSVQVLPGTTFAMGERRELFPLTGFISRGTDWDILPDDSGFIMIRNVNSLGRQLDRGELIVVENIFDELERLFGE